jgi:hypothetical protein
LHPEGGALEELAGGDDDEETTAGALEELSGASDEEDETTAGALEELTGAYDDDDDTPAGTHSPLAPHTASTEGHWFPMVRQSGTQVLAQGRPGGQQMSVPWHAGVQVPAGSAEELTGAYDDDDDTPAGTHSPLASHTASTEGHWFPMVRQSGTQVLAQGRPGGQQMSVPWHAGVQTPAGPLEELTGAYDDDEDTPAGTHSPLASHTASMEGHWFPMVRQSGTQVLAQGRPGGQQMSVPWHAGVQVPAGPWEELRGGGPDDEDTPGGTHCPFSSHTAPPAGHWFPTVRQSVTQIPAHGSSGAQHTWFTPHAGVQPPAVPLELTAVPLDEVPLAGTHCPLAGWHTSPEVGQA